MAIGLAEFGIIAALLLGGLQNSHNPGVILTNSVVNLTMPFILLGRTEAMQAPPQAPLLQEIEN